MTLRLVMGRAGTGKTRRCLDEIHALLQEKPLGPPLILIVPDQATFNMERELASRGGGMRAQVYSFRRLAYRVLRETGGAARRPVSELGRRMMLKSILLEQKNELNLLGTLHNRSGFLTSLSEIITEFKTCRVSPRDLAGLPGAEGKDGLEMKLRDLSLVYNRLSEKLANRLVDPDDYLDLLARQLPAAGFLGHCRVWVDGFISFTPQEWAVLKELLDSADDMVVTLCMDREAAQNDLPDHHPFVKPRETYLRMHRLARAEGVQVREDFLKPGTNPRFSGAPELVHLESHFFRYPAQPYRGPVQRISLVAGVNMRAEVEGVARSIRRLLRDEGLRLRQVMVAVRDVDVYFPLLRQALEDYQIPFFIDHGRPVMHHPLVELLRSALEVWQSNWLYDPVFRYLKSGLTRVSREEVDKLENYVLAVGIKGSSWYNEKPWRYVPGRAWAAEEMQGETLLPELKEINDIRRRAVKELRSAQLKVHDLAPGRPPRLAGRDWAGILLELCLELDVPRRLDRWSRAALETGKPDLAREHRQVWRLVGDLWDEFVEVLGETELTAAEVAAVLDAGLEAVNFSQIPPGPDVVTVGSLERSRPPGDVQALFIPGLSEGTLPANVRKYGVFTEREREQLSRRLADNNLELLPGTGDQLHREQFLIYRALTRTGGRLWLSYPLGDNEGRALTPSPVIRRVRELFPGLEVRLLPAEPPGDSPGTEFAEHPAGMLPRLPLRWQEATWGRAVHPLWWRAYNLLLDEGEWREKLALLIDGFTRRNVEPPLGKELGLKMWSRERKKSRVISGSVSSLETFVQCPFSHFLAYGLGLQERAVYRLAPPDTGQLYHEALRRFVERVSREPGWEQLRGREVQEICAGLVEELAPRLQGSILLSSSRLRQQKERLLERVSDSARALVRQVKAGRFRPAALEVYFGPRGKEPEPGTGTGRQGSFWPELFLPPLELDLGDGISLSLSGRIDRVDLGESNQGLFLSIIDYKSGPEKLDLARVLAGAQLQLLVYLWVALEHFAKLCCHGEQELVPAGAFYFRVQRPVLSLERPDLPGEELEKEWLKQFKLSGWLVDHGPDFWRLLDRSLEPGSSSLVVPAALKQDGNISGKQKASVYSPAEFRWFLKALRHLLTRAGKEIARGRVDIAPLKVGQSSACRFCSYGAVCRFDLWLPENRYRTLNENSRELRRRVEREAHRKGGDPFVLY